MTVERRPRRLPGDRISTQQLGAAALRTAQHRTWPEWAIPDSWADDDFWSRHIT
ncbi:MULTISPECIES: hypothetical protein [Rhodococcus erythropolis group]|uniref:hypothetical protein n=1 Tax=Rhodococcus erythropolis group TaxID=2840174 RepID=UPI000A5555B2|nr:MULTISPECIES: hypothetical protein [Rhodococcus erythropolis group]MDJ0441607.1 hypothetical protein [Rhodococcus qingshengii]